MSLQSSVLLYSSVLLSFVVQTKRSACHFSHSHASTLLKLSAGAVFRYSSKCFLAGLIFPNVFSSAERKMKFACPVINETEIKGFNVFFLTLIVTKFEIATTEKVALYISPLSEFALQERKRFGRSASIRKKKPVVRRNLIR